MKVTALRITDQMAIFEAKVFLDRSDNEPASNFVASLTREDTPNYIKETQETALSTALQDAGFGLQFADVSMGKDSERYGSAIPVSGKQTEGKTTVKEMPSQAAGTAAETLPALEKKVPTQTVKAPQAMPVAATTPLLNAETNHGVQSTAEKLPMNEQKESSEEHLLVKEATSEPAAAESLPVVSMEQDKVMESLPVNPAGKEDGAAKQLPVVQADETEQAESLPATPDEKPAQDKDDSRESKTIPFTSLVTTAAALAPESTSVVSEASEPATQEAPASIPAQSVETVTAAVPRYTEDMPVEDIAALMTYEEARDVKVDTGICNGWTIGRVADERTPSLKYYLYGYKGSNNILRAAAKVMLDSLTEQKAG
ncbi:hypothetical protein [Lacrimispora amygdalina]|nr:hypothetical protein [Clostridium indicum]